MENDENSMSVALIHLSFWLTINGVTRDLAGISLKLKRQFATPGIVLLKTFWTICAQYFQYPEVSEYNRARAGSFCYFSS